MKRILFIAASSSLLFLFANGQQDNQNDKEKETLMKIMQAHNDAILQGNSTWLSQNLYDKYFYISPVGNISTKDEVIKLFKSGMIKLESMNITDMKSFIYGDGGMVTELSTIKCRVGDLDISGQYRYLFVFAKSNGHWQIVAETGTYVRQQ
jgi:hypothetical protein